MTPENIVVAVEEIRDKYSGNLMARHFDKGYFNSLDSQLQQQLTKIILTGIKNPDSQMGCYAMNPQDYDLFSPMLDPMIRDFHAISPSAELFQQHDWNTNIESCDLVEIDPCLKDVSMRVRVARNVSTFPLPGAMTKEQHIAFEDMAAQAFTTLSQNPDFGGSYLSMTPGSANEISKSEYDSRVAAHQMFKDMSADPYLNAAGISSDWPHGRGIYMSRDEDFLVWVGEEDHLRIMAMKNDGNLNDLFKRLSEGLEALEKLLPSFATSKSYGNVSCCPTNLGTGMRASLHVKLPMLTSNGHDVGTLKREAKAFGLAVRGAGGEHSDAGEGGLVDISPIARLGVTEMDIMRCLYQGVAKLWEMETAKA